MTTRTINMAELAEYIDAALITDYELVGYFDRDAGALTPEDCCWKIWHKIMTNYPDAMLMGVEDGDKKIGYYVFEQTTLISFGLSPECRSRKYTELFWQAIKSEFTGTFNCGLYSYNTRAIEWLRKCGMEIAFANISILQLCQ